MATPSGGKKVKKGSIQEIGCFFFVFVQNKKGKSKPQKSKCKM